MEFNNDPKLTFVIPVYDTPLDIFKRCLMSIADQDYPNIEVVIVPNGGEKLCAELAQEYIASLPKEKALSWKVLPIADKGACAARNHGFQNSTGEIISFCNSDYILHVGIAQVWVDALQKHPDCGFVYGAYEYASNRQDVYWSKEFDVYELGVANYIDCGFPLWRGHVVEWDTEVKSLQDWDFWLRVVKSGVKGHYLGREISFIARYPAPKGLSEDSSQNWLERVRFIKEKNGIPERSICVTSIGAPTHGREIAKMLNADYRDDTLHKPHEYKGLYLIGWYMHPGQPQNGHSGIVARFPNSKKIIHFVGADIYWLRKFSVEHIREWAGAMKIACHHFLCENELAQEELRGYGIEAEIVPIPPYSDFEVKPLPDEFSVALYLTDKSDFDKYYQKHTLSIVKAMPDVKFYGYGDSDLSEFKSKNFKHKGFLPRPEWEKFVYGCSAYLRLVKHDTRPLATDEFLMAGRDVITNIPAPHVHCIDTSGDMPFNSWDKFAPGFSPLRWPETKKKIVQEIRAVRKKQKMDPMLNRLDVSRDIRNFLAKDAYRKKIQSLVDTKVELQVVN